MKIILNVIFLAFMSTSLSACYTAAVAGAGAAGGYVYSQEKKEDEAIE